MLHPVLPLVTRAQEESFMRATAPGEMPCMNGLQCWGTRTGGRVLPAFLQWRECVLCMRAETTLAWLSSQERDEIVQPYRVSVGPGEYAEEAILSHRTTAFAGITDPYPRFVQDRLRWQGHQLVQVNMEYRLTPSLCQRAVPPAQFMMQNLPFVDVSRELFWSGVFGARMALPSSSLLKEMQAAAVHAGFLQGIFEKGKKAKVNLKVKRLNELFTGAMDGSLAQVQEPLTPMERAAVDAIPKHVYIVYSMQRALWHKGSELNPHSTWIHSLGKDGILAAIYRIIRADQVLLQEARRRHPQFDAGTLDPNQETFAECMQRLIRRPGRADEPGSAEAWAALKANHAAGVKPDKDLLALVRNDYAKELANVRYVPLPAHRITKSRPDRDTQYLCAQCRKFKGVIMEKRQKMAYGGIDISLDAGTGKLHCFHKSGRKKRPCGELLPVQFYGNVVIMLNEAFIQCPTCLSARRLASAEPCCFSAEKPTCHFCHKSANLNPIRVFENSGLQGITFIHLCPSHTPSHLLKERKVWHRRLLMARLG